MLAVLRGGAVAVSAPTESADIAALRVKANAGDADAQLDFGYAYRDGQDVAQAAASFRRKAAEQGLAAAALGDAYGNGQGVLQHAVQASVALSPAQFDKDIHTCLTYGIRPRLSKTVRDAAWRLSCGYYDGQGIACSRRLAVAFAQLAAECGHPAAQGWLGSVYYVPRFHDRYFLAPNPNDSCGVEKNIEQALAYWEMAAAQEDPHALYCLGWAYEQGDVVPSDDAMAIAYYKRAADAGHEYSKARHDMLGGLPPLLAQA